MARSSPMTWAQIPVEGVDKDFVFTSLTLTKLHGRIQTLPRVEHNRIGIVPDNANTITFPKVACRYARQGFISKTRRTTAVKSGISILPQTSCCTLGQTSAAWIAVLRPEALHRIV